MEPEDEATVASLPQMLAVVGNDGAGKSTFVAAMARRQRSAGRKVHHYHYYDSLVRRLLRWLTGLISRIEDRKLTNEPAESGQPPFPGQSVDCTERRGGKALFLFLGVAVYQLCMAVETWLRLLAYYPRPLLSDRSHVDDIASIVALLGDSGAIFHAFAASLRLFPVRHIVYLKAPRREQFRRIAGSDLSEEIHRRKSLVYEKLVGLAQVAGLRVVCLERKCPSGTDAVDYVLERMK